MATQYVQSNNIAMITIEDANNEQYFINPINVIYVKKRENFWKILLTNGEVIMTKNTEGAMSIVNAIRKYS